MIYLFSNRALSGRHDGPEEVLAQYVEDLDYEFITTKTISNSNSIINNFSPVYNYHFLRHMLKIPKGSELVFFPFHTIPIFACMFLHNRFDYKVIAYDSFFRNYLLLRNRRRGLSNVAKNYVWITYFFILELLTSRVFKEIFFVSKKCCVFSEKYFKRGKSKLFSINVRVPKNYTLEAVDWSCGEVDILGPFLKDYDVHDLNNTIRKLKSFGVDCDRINLVGKGAKTVLKHRNFSERIEWLADYELFFKTRCHVVILNKAAGAGVPTKVQKLVRLRKTVFVHRGIDVGAGYLNLVGYF